MNKVSEYKIAIIPFIYCCNKFFYLSYNNILFLNKDLNQDNETLLHQIIMIIINE